MNNIHPTFSRTWFSTFLPVPTPRYLHSTQLYMVTHIIKHETQSTLNQRTHPSKKKATNFTLQ